MPNTVKGVEIDPVRENLIALLKSADDLPVVEAYGSFADYLIENGVTVSDTNVGKWIPVTERLPEQSGKYIVCSERKIKVGNWERMEKKVYQAKFYVYPNGWHWGQKDNGKYITHWMPMPEAPKGE